MQADIYGQAVSLINASEGPAYGVALLAAVGTGAFKSVSEACARCVKTVSKINVKPKNVKIYNELYPIYSALYPALAPQFQKMSAFAERYHRAGKGKN